MKYRRLSLDELEELKAPFTRFLAAQGIPAEDWVKIKTSNEERKNQIIDQFSQMVMDDVVTRAKFLQFLSKERMFLYKCDADKLYLRGLYIEGEVQNGFTNSENPSEMIKKVMESGAALKLAAAERSYKPSRNEDIYSLLESGAKILKDDSLYNMIDQWCQKHQ